jgi:hypothetical protein
VFSADGKRLAYWAQDPGSGRMVVDGVVGPAFETASAPAFSGDGGHVAYLAKRDRMTRVVLDGTPGPEYDEVIEGGPSFRADGTLGFLAIRERVLYRVTWAVPGSPR